MIRCWCLLMVDVPANAPPHSAYLRKLRLAGHSAAAMLSGVAQQT